MLIRAECDINACDKNKWTALMNACYWANEEAVLVLLKAGADSNLRNIVKNTFSSDFFFNFIFLIDVEFEKRTAVLLCTKCVAVQQLKKKKF